jgi:hypothetical protein
MKIKHALQAATKVSSMRLSRLAMAVASVLITARARLFRAVLSIGSF